MDDFISRQAAIDAHCELCDMNDKCICIYCKDIDRFESLPTADLSEYCDKLWKTAYERGKAEARVIKLTEADKESLRKAMENAELTLVAEPKKGKWVQRPGGYICIYMCSECGAVGHRTAFCPNCGARMGE